MTESYDHKLGIADLGVEEIPVRPTDGSYNEAQDEECAAFQARMPERIGAGEDLLMYPHMQTCERCRALLGDLEFIADFARRLLPIEEEPPEELWVHIVDAIERGEA